VTFRPLQSFVLLNPPVLILATLQVKALLSIWIRISSEVDEQSIAYFANHL